MKCVFDLRHITRLNWIIELVEIQSSKKFGIFSSSVRVVCRRMKHREHRISEAAIVIVFDVDDGVLVENGFREIGMVGACRERFLACDMENSGIYFVNNKSGAILNEVGVSLDCLVNNVVHDVLQLEIVENCLPLCVQILDNCLSLLVRLNVLDFGNRPDFESGVFFEKCDYFLFQMECEKKEEFAQICFWRFGTEIRIHQRISES